MDKRGVIEFECLRCDARHKEAYNVRKNAHCKSCGNIAYPVDEIGQPVKREAKKCKVCGSPLRKTNGSGLCATCDRP